MYEQYIQDMSRTTMYGQYIQGMSLDHHVWTIYSVYVLDHHVWTIYSGYILGPPCMNNIFRIYLRTTMYGQYIQDIS